MRNKTKQQASTENEKHRLQNKLLDLTWLRKQREVRASRRKDKRTARYEQQAARTNMRDEQTQKTRDVRCQKIYQRDVNWEEHERETAKQHEMTNEPIH